MGWNLHPTIAEFVKSSVQEVLIADFACGNGIWTMEESRNHAKTTQIQGFDLSDTMFPNSRSLPENVKFEVLDARKSVPAHLCGHFDVVHCRLILGAVRNGDPSAFMKTFVNLLKPGGWLQWDEVNVNKMTIYSSNKSDSKWETILMNLAERARQEGAKFKWILERSQILEGWGFSNVVEVKGGDAKPELRRFWSDNEIAVLGEIASTAGSGIDQVEKLAEARDHGLDIHPECLSVIGKLSNARDQKDVD